MTLRIAWWNAHVSLALQKPKGTALSGELRVDRTELYRLSGLSLPSIGMSTVTIAVHRG
jgi:hypothetical protein